MKAPLAMLSMAAVLLASSPGRAEPTDPDPWFGPDKFLHFTASALIASGSYGLSTFAVDPPGYRAAIGAGVGLSAGVGKELFDLGGFGQPSWKDLAWDVFGVSVGVGLAIAIDYAARSPTPAGAR